MPALSPRLCAVPPQPSSSLRGALLAILLGTLPAAASAQAASGSTFSIDLARSWNAGSVRPREPLDATLTGVVVRWTHPLGTLVGVSWHYVVEGTPVMVTRLGASAERLALIGDWQRTLYTPRRGLGAGIAPVALQASRRLSHRYTVVAEGAGGAAVFTSIMPYGDDGTRANFTATARVLLSIGAPEASQWAVGYALHHISNGGLGRANPGVNANMLVVRWTHPRSAPP